MNGTRKIKVSVIVVTYKERAELLTGLTAIYRSNKNKQAPIMEVIVVDNDVQSTLKSVLRKKFPLLRYIKTGANIGFGAANNAGAAIANGQYLFFLNPDTEIQAGAITELVNFLDQRPKAIVVAPTLLNMQNQPYADQGSAELTPIAAIGAHSILHRVWPSNPVAHHYWLRSRDLTKPQQLAVAPGTALMIRRSVFEQVGGFDRRFFIYFEEHDLCRRVRQLGGEVWLLPSANVKHIWHAATQAAVYKQVYRDSRRRYFYKYYGPFIGTGIEALLNLNSFSLGMIAGLVILLAGLVVFNPYATAR